MSSINWSVVLVIGVWLCAAIACFGTHDSGPIAYATILTAIYLATKDIRIT